MPAGPICAECGTTTTDDARGWRSYLCDVDDDEQDEIVSYCPACADREFAPPD